jgi:uncharacterized protein
MTTAREVFEEMNLTGGLRPESLAEDVVIEEPFAPDGRPRRIEGKAAWLAFATKERADLPFRLDSQRVTAVHETADPQVLVVEYELTGTALASGRTSTAPFIGVLRVRDGLVVGWREYQDKAAIARALA